jgi:hypothetical protein
MTVPVLLVALAPGWLGTARIPRALTLAGFGVSLFSRSDPFVESGGYIQRLHRLPDQVTPLQWAFAFSAAVREAQPRLVIACDDQAWIMLQTVAEHPPPGMSPGEYEHLAGLLRESLGDPAHYRASTNKTLLPPAAKALGVRMPPSAVVSNVQDVESFAAAEGYPVVLKLAYGFGGDGTAICGSRSEVARELARLRTGSAADLGASSDTLSAQAYVPGGITYYAVAAWQGRVLSGYATDRVVGHPEPKGPACVVRYHRDPQLRDFAERLVRGFGVSGLIGLECIVHESTGEAFLIEINRRVTPGMDRGRLLGVDLCAALRAAAAGLPLPTRTDLDEGETGIRCSFPQEWLRDPDSEWLRRYPVDVPWDEPDLIRAMLALRARS